MRYNVQQKLIHLISRECNGDTADMTKYIICDVEERWSVFQGAVYLRSENWITFLRTESHDVKHGCLKTRGLVHTNRRIKMQGRKPGAKVEVHLQKRTANHRMTVDHCTSGDGEMFMN